MDSEEGKTYKIEEGIEAVPCKDFYAAEIEAEAQQDSEEEGFFTQEYVNTIYEWICPNVTQIGLLNDLSSDIEDNAYNIEARVY